MTCIWGHGSVPVKTSQAIYLTMYLIFIFPGQVADLARGRVTTGDRILSNVAAGSHIGAVPTAVSATCNNLKSVTVNVKNGGKRSKLVIEFCMTIYSNFLLFMYLEAVIYLIGILYYIIYNIIYCLKNCWKVFPFKLFLPILYLWLRHILRVLRTLTKLLKKKNIYIYNSLYYIDIGWLSDWQKKIKTLA